MYRNIHGFVIIDKPKNITSAKVVSHVKSRLHANKVGHAGTLDPFATGVIICCLNRATKLARFLLSGKKSYEALLHLGVDTDTQDATGNILATNAVPHLTETELRDVLNTYIGLQEQSPPIFSALKHKGVPLYKHARSGNPIKKPPRQIEIFSLNIREMSLPFIRFEVVCSAGTYIRTLGADIGGSLGCGGHLKELRRLECSGFTIEEAIGLQDLEQLISNGRIVDHVIPMASALRGMPEWPADDAMEKKIVHGMPLRHNDVVIEDATPPINFVKVVDGNRELLAVIEYVKALNKYKYCCVFN